MNNYTEEQTKDIQERITKANQYFKEIQLIPVVQFIPTETKSGDIINAVVIALQDTKYPQPEEKAEVVEEPVIAEKINE